MMKLLRLLNPIRHLRIERELAILSAKHTAICADVVTYYGMTSRQIDPRSEPATLARMFAAQNDLGIARMVVARALRDMRAGRHDVACAELEAILGEAHVEPKPIHLVDRVA